MYEDLIKNLRYLAKVYSICENENMQEYKLTVEAADAIEVLSKMEKTTQWIPVTERLPKEQETVLTWGEQGIILLNWRHDNKWCGCLGDVTNWMPLPKPPKEDE